MNQSRAMRRRWRAMCQIAATSIWVSGASVALVAVPTSAFAQGQNIGRLEFSRQVLVTPQAISSGSPQYVAARQGQEVFPGQGVRTLRRSQAEIKFNDKSVLRVNERTDLVVQDTASLRRIQLNSGLIWVRVAKGVATQVETPSATAVARGTRFTVAALPDGSMLLTVYEGEVAAQMNGKEVIVHPGEQILIKKDGQVPDAPRKLNLSELPEEMGGSYHSWWDDVAENAGLSVLNGTTYGNDLRTTLTGEALQQLAAEGLVGNGFGDDNNIPSLFLNNAQDRARLLSIAQNSLVNDFRNSGLSLDAYRKQFGAQSISARFSQLTASDASFLTGAKVSNVDQFVQSALVNGSSLNVPVGTRAYYQPGSLKGTPNFDLNLLDRTESNDSLLGIGAAAAFLANAALGNKWSVSVPKVELSAFDLQADPTSFIAGRARVTGLIGKTRYQFESNGLQLVDSDLTRKRFSKLASIANVEQNVAPGITVFAGRRRFYHGPVFQNQNLSQLIADRYSSAGVTVKEGPLSFEGAYVHDINPAIQGAQKGGLGSVFYRFGGGQFGAHYIHVPDLTGKDGYTGSFSFPVVPNRLDIYGEAGRGPDKATLQTYGFYLPSLFQLTQTDFFVEYGSHGGLGKSITFVASRDAGKYVNFRAFANFAHYDGFGKDNTAGLATLIRFGN